MGQDAGTVMMVVLVAVGIVAAWRYLLRVVLAAALSFCFLGAVAAYVALAR